MNNYKFYQNKKVNNFILCNNKMFKFNNKKRMTLQ